MTERMAKGIGTIAHTAPPEVGYVLAQTQPRHAVIYHFFNDFDTAGAVEGDACLRFEAARRIRLRASPAAALMVDRGADLLEGGRNLGREPQPRTDVALAKTWTVSSWATTYHTNEQKQERKEWTGSFTNPSAAEPCDPAAPASNGPTQQQEPGTPAQDRGRTHYEQASTLLPLPR